MTVTIDGEVFNSGKTDDPSTAFVTAPALEHKYKEIKRQIIEYPTHGETGTGIAHVWYKCEQCSELTPFTLKGGDEYNDRITLDGQPHTWGEMVYEAVSNIKTDENGK